MTGLEILMIGDINDWLGYIDDRTGDINDWIGDIDGDIWRY